MDNDFTTGYIAGQNDGGGRNNGGLFGGDGSFLWVLVIFALLFGWGGNGFGAGGGNGGGMPSGFVMSNLDAGIRGVQQGLADGFYAMNTGMLNGFHGVDNAICNLGYQTQQGFNTLGFQQQQCCCETQRLIERGFCDTNYNLATNTNNIVQSGHADTDRVIAKLDQMEAARQAEKIEALRLENQTLRFQASQLDQNAAIRAAIDAATAEVIRRTGNECPIPAYVVPNPNCCYGNPVGVSYGAPWNNAGACCA